MYVIIEFQLGEPSDMTCTIDEFQLDEDLPEGTLELLTGGIASGFQVFTEEELDE